MVDREIFCQKKGIFNDLYEESSESEAARSATSRMTRILDNDYHKVNLPAIVGQCTHSNEEERAKLLALLHKHELIFDGTLGKWNVPPLDLELKPGSTPYRARCIPYT